MIVFCKTDRITERNESFQSSKLQMLTPFLILSRKNLLLPQSLSHGLCYAAENKDLLSLVGAGVLQMAGPTLDTQIVKDQFAEMQKEFGEALARCFEKDGHLPKSLNDT